MGLIIGLIVNAVLWCIPLYRLLPRAGMNPNLAILGVVPILGTVLLWILAFKRWPSDGAAGV